MKFYRLFSVALIALALLTACIRPDLPGAPQLPKPPSPRSIPGLEDLLDKLPGFDLDMLRELGLPDLSSIADLPQLADLPGLALAENAIAFAGPTEMRINVGDVIHGTDIQLGPQSSKGGPSFSSPACAPSGSRATRSTSTAPGPTLAASTMRCVCVSTAWPRAMCARPASSGL